MESFFLAETTKYLYLLFDPENFIHNRGQHGTVVTSNWGECVLDAGGYVFNTGWFTPFKGGIYDPLCSTFRRQTERSDVSRLVA